MNQLFVKHSIILIKIIFNKHKISMLIQLKINDHLKSSTIINSNNGQF
jgi:hypothetical protein